jgi:hypothetical protein
MLGLVGTSQAAAQDTTRKESKGDVAAAPSFATMMTAVNATSSTIGKVDALTDLKAEQIRIVDVKTLISDANEKELTTALDRNKTATDSLQKSLQKHQLVSKAITDHPSKFEPDDVVAADVTADGMLTLYVWKR